MQVEFLRNDDHDRSRIHVAARQNSGTARRPAILEPLMRRSLVVAVLSVDVV